MVLMMALLGAALGTAMLWVADIEIASAASFRDGAETLHAVEGAMEAAIDELSTQPDWTGVLSGAVSSRFAQGTSHPVTRLAGSIDLAALTADLQAETDARAVWGANNPQWRLFSHGSLEALVGAADLTGPYLAVWIADDEAESDGNPLVDSNGIVKIRAEARGRRRSRRMVEAVIAHAASAGIVRLVLWREVR